MCSCWRRGSFEDATEDLTNFIEQRSKLLLRCSNCCLFSLAAARKLLLLFDKIRSCVGSNYPFLTLKERDIETGLDYFGARYYVSTQGRFTSTDPLLSSGTIYDPQTWNRYSYTVNRPTILTDPLGLFVWGTATEDERERFRVAFKAAQSDLTMIGEKFGLDSSEYTEAKRALDSYGKEGVDNGVTVSVGTLKNTNANAETDVSRGIGQISTDNPNGQRIRIRFSPKGIKSEALEETVVHEGSHAADGSDWVYRSFRNAPTYYATEFRAFSAESGISQVRHPDVTVSIFLESVLISGKNPVLPERVYLWNPSWKAADIATMRSANINKLLSHPKEGGGYGVSLTNQGGPAFK